MTRAERAAEAARLKAEGLNGIQVAARMGVSRSYAYELLDDPEGTKVRTRKASYSGICVDCGAPTCGNDGRSKAPKRCAACGATRHADRNARVFRWWEQGVHTSLIASREGMTENAVLSLVNWHRHRNGEPIALRRRRSRELWPKIEQLWREGKTLTEIAAECDTNAANVNQMVQQIRKAGIDLPFRNERRAAA